MLRISIWAFAMLALALVSGCIEEEINFDALRAKRDYSLEVATNVHITYTDSAVLRVRIDGPELKRYIYRFKIEEEFSKGVDVEFYDLLEQPTAWMHANWALRKPNEKVVIARDSVVPRNSQGESLHSYEVIWNERDKTLSTDKITMITRPPADTIYSRGFTTNEDFTEYELHSVEGDMTFRRFKSRMSGDPKQDGEL